MMIVLLFCKFRLNTLTKIFAIINIVIVRNNNKNPIDLYNSITIDHSEIHAPIIISKNKKREEYEKNLFIFSVNIENFVLINIPISTGTVVINNRPTLIFKNFKSCKTVISLIIIGETTINMKGIVIKDKIAEIAVKETDKAMFPFANLVI